MSKPSKARIYIVDDDDAVRASTRLLLESMDYAVEDFADAESLLRSLGDQHPDCLIVDRHMPGLSGLDLLETLREKGVQTPAILMTANNRHMAARVARAGAVAVLHKPVAPETLSLWLDKIFSKNK
jgi:FixJ family two-component response regulator